MSKPILYVHVTADKFPIACVVGVAVGEQRRGNCTASDTVRRCSAPVDIADLTKRTLAGLAADVTARIIGGDHGATMAREMGEGGAWCPDHLPNDKDRTVPRVWKHLQETAADMCALLPDTGAPVAKPAPAAKVVDHGPSIVAGSDVKPAKRQAPVVLVLRNGDAYRATKLFTSADAAIAEGDKHAGGYVLVTSDHDFNPTIPFNIALGNPPDFASLVQATRDAMAAAKAAAKVKPAKAKRERIPAGNGGFRTGTSREVGRAVYDAGVAAGQTRKDILAAMVAKGIHKTTAACIYALFKKNDGIAATAVAAAQGSKS